MSAPYYASESVTVWHGDCLDVLAGMAAESVDSVVTDPPYGLEFMGKEWDSFAPARTQYHGERADTRVNIQNDTSKPSSRHRVSFPMGRPTFRRCTVCGRREFSGTPCRCAEPVWTYEQPEGTPTRMAAYQSWCQSWAAECLRVLKPGGHLLAFGGTRTWHRLACAVEDAGFEIRDSIAWVYSQGFPKSLDVSKAIDKAARGVPQGGTDPTSPNHGRYRTTTTEGKRWDGDSGQGYGAGGSRFLADGAASGSAMGRAASGDAAIAPDAARWQGWGTALKPAFEPVVVARKPLAGTVAANVLRYGTGAINVDGCRVGMSAADRETINNMGGYGRSGYSRTPSATYQMNAEGHLMPSRDAEAHAAGRWPPNVALDDTGAAELDEQSGERPAGGRVNGTEPSSPFRDVYGDMPGRLAWSQYDDRGGASRFFPVFRYEAKAPTSERPRIRRDGAGEGRVEMSSNKTRECNVCGTRTGPQTIGELWPNCGHDDWSWVEKLAKANHVAHPTVKPLDLIRWLVRLVTPPGGIVLDPFAGSGTTAEAAILEGFRAVVVEREAEYLPHITQRIHRRRNPVAYLQATRADDDPPTLFEALP